MPCDASAARLLVEELYAPAFLADRELLETTRFPSVDKSRGWDDVDAWWTANAVGNGHPQAIVEDTFLYRWNKGDSDLRQTRIGPTGLSAQMLASDGREN